MNPIREMLQDIEEGSSNYEINISGLNASIKIQRLQVQNKGFGHSKTYSNLESSMSHLSFYST